MQENMKKNVNITESLCYTAEIKKTKTKTKLPVKGALSVPGIGILTTRHREFRAKKAG